MEDKSVNKEEQKNQNQIETNDLSDLRKSIEKVRRRLHQNISDNSKEKMLKTSQELDEVITKYLKMQSKYTKGSMD